MIFSEDGGDENIMKGRKIVLRRLRRLGDISIPTTWPAMGVYAGGETSIYGPTANPPAPQPLLL